MVKASNRNVLFKKFSRFLSTREKYEKLFQLLKMYYIIMRDKYEAKYETTDTISAGKKIISGNQMELSHDDINYDYFQLD